MLHLAQVQGKNAAGKGMLKVLARQKADHLWSVLKEPDTLDVADGDDFPEGMLVLVELAASGQVISIQDAQPWVLDLVQEYLTAGVSPTLLEQEAQRSEQWRQSLTLQSQELARRSLELEARRDQIQELEEKLRREKKQLETLAADLQTQTNTPLS